MQRCLDSTFIYIGAAPPRSKTNFQLTLVSFWRDERKQNNELKTNLSLPLKISRMAVPFSKTRIKTIFKPGNLIDNY